MLWFSRASRLPFAAIDLGTAFVRVGTPADPLRVERPTQRRGGGPPAMRRGFVNDVNTAADVLAGSLAEAGVRRSQLVVSAPATITPVERAALLSALRAAGVERAPMLIEEPVAAAIGLGLDIADDLPRLIVDVGHGITEAAVIASGGIQAIAAAPVGCVELRPDLDERCAAPTPDDSRAPTSPLFRDDRHVDAALNAISRTVRTVLTDTPVEAAAAIDLVHLVGGGALVANVGDHLARATGLDIECARDPLHAVALGDAACAAAVAMHRNRRDRH